MSLKEHNHLPPPPSRQRIDNYENKDVIGPSGALPQQSALMPVYEVGLPQPAPMKPYQNVAPIQPQSAMASAAPQSQNPYQNQLEYKMPSYQERMKRNRSRSGLSAQKEARPQPINFVNQDSLIQDQVNNQLLQNESHLLDQLKMMEPHQPEAIQQYGWS